MGRVWFRGRPARPPPFPVPACGVGVCAGPGSRLCPALLGWVVGVCFFFCAFVFFSFFFFFFPVPGFVVPVSPPPFFFFSGWAAGSLFFSFSFRCPFSRWAAVPGLVLPLLGGWSPCASLGVLSSVPFGGGVWLPLVVLAGGLAAVGCFRAFSPSPLLFFGGGGLPVPPSAFSGLAHALACIQCCLPGCCLQLRSVWPRSGPMGRVGYVHGGLGAPSCRVRSWLCRLGGCARRLLVVFGLWGWCRSCPFPSAVPAAIFWVVRHRCRPARCGPVCGLRCWCVACWRGAFEGVQWLASVSPSG